MAAKKTPTPIIEETTILDQMDTTDLRPIPNADDLFNEANKDAEERIAKELAVETMSNEELNAEFGFSLAEAIGILEYAITNSGSLHKDKMLNSLADIERTSQL